MVMGALKTQDVKMTGNDGSAFTVCPVFIARQHTDALSVCPSRSGILSLSKLIIYRNNFFTTR